MSTYAAVCARLPAPGGVGAGDVGLAAAAPAISKLDHEGLVGAVQGPSIKQGNNLLALVPALHPAE